MKSRKILFTGILLACFSGILAVGLSVQSALNSGALPTGSAMLAALNDKNGQTTTQSDLQNANFWNNDNGINWDPATSGTAGSPWLKVGTAIPIQRSGQQGYSPFLDMTVTVASTEDYKNILGLYGYKITINLTNNLNFGGDSLPPLFNVVAFFGNGHTISNFSIKGEYQHVGLLATVTDTINNLTLKINSIGEGSYSNFGALVGYLPAGATIRNCHVVSNGTSIATISGKDNVGGLVGLYSGTIDSCSVSSVNITTTVSYAGGLAGKCDGTAASITNCSVDSVSVTANSQYAGGLVGYNTAKIDSCSATRVVVGCGQ